MLNFKPLRRHGDGLADIASKEAAISFDPTLDKTRQEFKDETDINVILKRFGIGAVPGHRPVYGEVDHTLDLQGAFEARDAAIRMHQRLPAELQDQFPTWREVIAAAENGELEKAFSELKENNRKKAREAKRQELDELDSINADRQRDREYNEWLKQREQNANLGRPQKVTDSPNPVT